MKIYMTHLTVGLFVVAKPAVFVAALTCWVKAPAFQKCFTFAIVAQYFTKIT